LNKMSIYGPAPPPPPLKSCSVLEVLIDVCLPLQSSLVQRYLPPFSSGVKEPLFLFPHEQPRDHRFVPPPCVSFLFPISQRRARSFFSNFYGVGSLIKTRPPPLRFRVELLIPTFRRLTPFFFPPPPSNWKNSTPKVSLEDRFPPKRSLGVTSFHCLLAFLSLLIG